MLPDCLNALRLRFSATDESFQGAKDTIFAPGRYFGESNVANWGTVW
jgi:hypothetical protein